MSKKKKSGNSDKKTDNQLRSNKNYQHAAGEIEALRAILKQNQSKKQPNIKSDENDHTSDKNQSSS